MEVGDIFWLPKYKAPTNIGGHFVVVLRIDIEGKMVYIQILQSGIFKIFENFGILNQNGCASCSTHEKTLAFKRYLSNRGLSLDVDSVIFLNYKKYNHFLFKETFICYKNLEKDSYFDFEYKVSNNIYIFKGSLLPINRKQTILAIRYAKQISDQDKMAIVNSFAA